MVALFEKLNPEMFCMFSAHLPQRETKLLAILWLAFPYSEKHLPCFGETVEWRHYNNVIHWLSFGWFWVVFKNYIICNIILCMQYSKNNLPTSTYSLWHIPPRVPQDVWDVVGCFITGWLPSVHIMSDSDSDRLKPSPSGCDKVFKVQIFKTAHCQKSRAMSGEIQFSGSHTHNVTLIIQLLLLQTNQMQINVAISLAWCLKALCIYQGGDVGTASKVDSIHFYKKLLEGTRSQTTAIFSLNCRHHSTQASKLEFTLWGRKTSGLLRFTVTSANWGHKEIKYFPLTCTTLNVSWWETWWRWWL